MERSWMNGADEKRPSKWQHCPEWLWEVFLLGKAEAELLADGAGTKSQTPSQFAVSFS